MQTTKTSLPTSIESTIIMAISDSLNMVELIANSPLSKEAHIFFEHLILSLYELSYWAGGRSTEALNSEKKNEKYFKSITDKNIIDVMTKVCDIRNAICHRTSEKVLLNPNIRLSCNFNFKGDDIEIQYGQIKILFLQDVVNLYMELRKFFSASYYLSRWKDHPMWVAEENKLKQAMGKLKIFIYDI